MTNTPTYEELKTVTEDYPCRLIVMLYDEAIRNLVDAVDAINRQEIERRFEATKKVSEIITELHLSLDWQQGGEISQNLSGIYRFVLTQLPRINFDNDTDVAEQLIGLIRPIRDAWMELDDRIHANVAMAEAEEAKIIGTAALATAAMGAGASA